MPLPDQMTIWKTHPTLSMVKDLIWEIINLKPNLSVYGHDERVNAIRDRLIEFEKKIFFCPHAFRVLWRLENTLVKTVFHNIVVFMVQIDLEVWWWPFYMDHNMESWLIRYACLNQILFSTKSTTGFQLKTFSTAVKHVTRR